LVKYLIIRFSSIGDIVLTTPVIRCLKKQVEGAVIHFATKAQYKTVIQANPYIDKIHILNDSLKDLIEELRKEDFHYIIDLHNNIRTFIIKRKLGLLSFSFNKLNIEKWLLVNFKINKLPQKHIVDRYFETIKLFDVTNDGEGLDYFTEVRDEVNLLSLPEPFPWGYIAFVIGAKHQTKRLPIDKIILICMKINYPIILLGGKEDYELGEKVAKLLKENIYNACGRYTLNQSAAIVRQAKVVITHDTGLMHIAAAYNKKIVSIWGNTIPEFGMYPYLGRDNSAIVQNEKATCRPCSKIGFEKCPKKHFRCMNDISVDLVAVLALKFLIPIQTYDIQPI